jgi:hypothetical protein
MDTNIENGFYNSDTETSDDETQIEDSELNTLRLFVKQYIELDDNISILKNKIKPTTVMIKELSVKKRKLSTVIAELMTKNDIFNISPQSKDGSSIGKITRVTPQRKNPTYKAFENTVLEHFKGNVELLKKVKEKALTKCDPAKPSLRRVKPKTT